MAANSSSTILDMILTNYKDMLAEAIDDPLVNSWFLMQSPYPMLAIVAFYLYFVLSLGPRLMEKREAFNLKYLMIAYNGYQVIFSLWLCTMPFRYGAFTYFVQHGCRPLDHNYFGALAVAVSDGAWWYFFSKVVELLDTVFFVLRKKQSQVTFLHVYHHSLTTVFAWSYLKYLPGEQGVVIGCLNSLVHVVMYSYYLLAALGPRYQKYLWWKKYMTWIQLGQFCIMLTYLSFLLAFDCALPKALTLMFTANSVIFLYLFSRFYKKAYAGKNAGKISEKISAKSHTHGFVETASIAAVIAKKLE